MKRNILERFLNEYLKVREVSDSSVNGLQVEGSPEIKKIAFSVSYSIDVAEKSIKNGADTIIVHHGILWQNLKPLTSIFKKRIEILLKNNINLFAYHLPLDIHPEIGNNISILKILGAKKIRTFAKYEEIDIGVIGRFKKEKSMDEIKKILKLEINKDIFSLEYGKRKIKTVGIITGGGDKYFEEAIINNCELFITGERNETNFETAREYEVNFISLGHYKSEILGIKNLQEIIKNNFKVETLFIDTKNPV
jgi:dinuclear metal center YbgI/SA1388 family protein